MPMIQSRIAEEARTTIPPEVREALGLRDGDTLAYLIEDGRVILTRAPDPGVPDDRVDPFAAFIEWAGEADRKAYAGF